MHIQQVLAFLGAATLSLSALAEPSIAPSSVAGATLARDGAQATVRMTLEDARHMRGTYLLDDGRTIAITSEGRKLFADLDGKREELVRVGQTRFVSRDTGTRIAFNRAQYADEVVVDQATR